MLFRIFPRLIWLSTTFVGLACGLASAQGQISSQPFEPVHLPPPWAEQTIVRGPDPHQPHLTSSRSVPQLGTQFPSTTPGGNHFFAPPSGGVAEQGAGFTTDAATHPPQWEDSSVVGCQECVDCLQFLPNGLLYKAYMAGEKEPRFKSVWLDDDQLGAIWEVGLGGRLGLVRYGSTGPVRPEGWQIDLQGGVLPRLITAGQDLVAVDYRIGLFGTWRRGPTAIKFGYDHLSSHLGDEFLLANPGLSRRNYVRDAIVLGVSCDATADVRFYGEIGASPATDGGAEPLEVQYGVEYSPRCPGGAPFAAVNSHLREEFDFGGSFNILGGWQWRSSYSDRIFRVGGQYYHGKALQYSFFDKQEELLGAGMWMDY